MPAPNIIQAEGNSDDAAIALRLKFVGQELIMAAGAIERAKEQLEIILDTARMRAGEIQREQGGQYKAGLDRALQIVDKYLEYVRANDTAAVNIGMEGVLVLVHKELLAAMQETR